MKKKIFALTTVALFAIGLAFYANNTSSLNVLSEDNIEALTDGEGFGSYTVYGSSPERIVVDNITHVVIFEGKGQDRDYRGNSINACTDEYGGSCTINTTTTVYNVGIILNYIERFFEEFTNARAIIDWIKSLFN